ncbi:MAG: hypothetical protein ACK4WB_05190 [Desulfatiglandales bacterium]
MEEAKAIISESVAQFLREDLDLDFLEEEVQRVVKRLFVSHFDRRPLIIPIIITV